MWWARAPLRLVLLLVVLAGVAAYGVPQIVQNAVGDSSSRCQLAPFQPLLHTSLADVERAVVISHLSALVGNGSLDVQGLQEPSAAWSDVPPVNKASRDPTLTPADAGYEIRWWSPQQRDHQAADLFVFPSAREAARYVQLAAASRCRQRSATYTVTRPGGARVRIWNNPEDYLQADLFFARGNRAYRVVEVPPDSRGKSPAEIVPRRLISTTQQLACQLKDAECSAGGPPGSVSSFGAWAGYRWDGHVNSVGAAWRVPRIMKGSPAGFAGTWIGAEAPPRRSPTLAQSALVPRSLWTTAMWSSWFDQIPFIQVGTNENREVWRHHAANVYYAFWTDTVHRFEPIALFAVRPGDLVAAKLMRARRDWVVSIIDATSGARRIFSTRDEARYTFDSADWMQEHPGFAEPITAHMGNEYPRLSRVRLHDVAVNFAAPRYDDLLSSWMTDGAVYLEPGALNHDSFVLHETGLSASGARYLKLATTLNAATQRFEVQLSAWRTVTPRSQITLQSSAYADAVESFLSAVATVPWPGGARSQITILIHRFRAVLDQTRSASELTSRSLSRWQDAWLDDGMAASQSALAARRALNLPQIESVP